MIIVSDSTCLCHPALVGQHGLLHHLFGRVIIPPAAAAELAAGSSKRPEINQVLGANWSAIRALEDTDQEDLLALTLDREEAEALILALELNCALLMDDLPGRKHAHTLKLKFTGTLGVLVAAKAKGLTQLTRPLIQHMIQEDGFRASQKLLEETLMEVGE